VASLRTSQVQALTTDQVQALTTVAVAAFITTQIAVLGTDQVQALTTDQVQSLSSSQLQALNTSQVAAMETSDIAVLKTSQATALKTTQIQALTTDQVQALNTAVIASLTTRQIAALTTVQVESMTTVQAAALTSAQIPLLQLGTPLVLDLNGDGVSTTGYSQGVKFDLFATGEQVQTGWVSSSDGLLVLDRNHDGSINDGSELFGSSTTLSDGQRATDGYQALRDLDSNHDGAISADDAAYNELRVWVDANTDGVSNTGELRSLGDLGITKINLNASVSGALDHGNLVGLTSTYETSDGATHAAADVWFVADANPTNAAANINIDTQIAQTVAQLQNSYAPATPADGQPPADNGLVGRVNVMAQSLSSFSEQQSNAPGNGAGNALQAPGSNAQPASGVVATVSGMSEQLKNFDAFGKPLAGSSELAAPSSLKKPDGLSGIGMDANNGILAMGGGSK
jgi:hypothetical protein